MPATALKNTMLMPAERLLFRADTGAVKGALRPEKFPINTTFGFYRERAFVSSVWG
jgi:hypothetical protein